MVELTERARQIEKGWVKLVIDYCLMQFNRLILEKRKHVNQTLFIQVLVVVCKYRIAMFVK
jgi:hypothetical protein